jgi:hypothetical protein
MDTPVLRNLIRVLDYGKREKMSSGIDCSMKKEEDDLCVHLFYGYLMNNERNKKRTSGENGNVLAKISGY